MRRKLYTKRKKRIVAQILAFLMVFTLLPTNFVSAEEVQEDAMCKIEEQIQDVEQEDEEIGEEQEIVSEETVTVEMEDQKAIEKGRMSSKAGEEEGIKGESLTIDKEEIQLFTEESKNQQQLTAKILPEEMENEWITWSSSDEAIATVDENGLVTAVSNGLTIITANGAGCEDTCLVYVGIPVFFCTEQEGVQVTVANEETSFIVYDYEELLKAQEKAETETSDESEHSEKIGTEEEKIENQNERKYVTFLDVGSYSYTAKGDAENTYYASVCAFSVTEDGKVKFRTEWSAEVLSEYKMNELLDGDAATFYLQLEVFEPSDNLGAWNGTTIDVSWFDPTQKECHITNAEQFAGFAAIVNGIYNAEIIEIKDAGRSFTPEEYESYEAAKIKKGCSVKNTGGPNGLNEVTSTDYYFNVLGYDFEGMTVYLDSDIDMGGYLTADGSWSGARYMPIGGQYQMHYVKRGIADGFSHLGSSFNGTFNGQGHIVFNIYCDRYSVTNYGDSSTIGLFGRLGIHDSDYESWKQYGDQGGNSPAKNPTIRNVAVDGYIYGRRSIGGVVGKIGQTTASLLKDGSIGGIVENCINFAEVHNTDAKGCGGIVGAAWSAGIVRNCVNFGSVSSTYNCPTAGIVGSNEISIVNCYNVGRIKAKSNSYAMAIGTNNGGGTDVRNCYWMTTSAPGGGYYKWDKAEVTEITDQYNETNLPASEYMKSDKFLSDINGTGRQWSNRYENTSVYSYMLEQKLVGMPLPLAFAESETETILSYEATEDTVKTDYVEGEKFDISNLEIWANWSDGRKELVENFTVKLDDELLDRELTLEDNGKEVTVSVGTGKIQWEKTYKILVDEVQLSLIQVKNAPDKCVYNDGEKFDPTGMVVTIRYTNGKFLEVSYKDNEFKDAEDTVYEIELEPAAGNEVKYDTWNNKYTKVSYEFKNTTMRVSGVQLVVIPSEGRPEQDEENVYLVKTEEELDWIASQVNGGVNVEPSIKLLNDIVITKEYTPIGSSEYPFKGSFDGAGHTLELQGTMSGNARGIFGYAENAQIKNLIVDGTINGGLYVGGIIGWAADVQIENCGNKVDITGSADVGGIVGYVSFATENTGTKLVGCYNTGEISSALCAGGILGSTSNTKCSITNCYNWGDISGAGSSSLYAVGGIVGAVSAQTEISNVYNAGHITATKTNGQYVGAIGGRINKVLGENCYWLTGRGVSVAATAPDYVKLDSDTGKANSVEELNQQMQNIEQTMFISNHDTELQSDCLKILSWQEPTGHEMEDGICRYCGESTYLLGDMNENGVVNILDVQMLFEHVMGTTESSNTNLFVIADLNGDKKINIYDVQILFEQVMSK